MNRTLLASAIALLIPLTSAIAQTTAPALQPSIPNPLRTTQPPPSVQAQSTQPKATPSIATTPSTTEPAKPKRERSAKQKQSDDDMRACGESWRGDKDALKAKGQTWRTYLKECRGLKKTARGV
jgi:hypothetical protein